MSRGLVWSAVALGFASGVLLVWEFWTDSAIEPAQIARTVALTVFLSLIAGLAWLTRE